MVEKFPNLTALQINKDEVTYLELDTIAKIWANDILTNLATQPKRIGIFAYRSKASYIIQTCWTCRCY